MLHNALRRLSRRSAPWSLRLWLLSLRHLDLAGREERRERSDPASFLAVADLNVFCCFLSHVPEVLTGVRLLVLFAKE